MGTRLAVLGLSGLALIAMVAGALRIHGLEQRIAALETARAPVALAPVAAVSYPGLDFRWEPAGNDQMAVQPPHQFPQFPNAPTRHEINGMTYYVVPLADSGGAKNRR
jgi:hypothetical protein